MNSRIITCRLFFFLLFLSLGFNLNADVIDSYTANQGPFTVGPGEKIADADALVLTPSVLGGFRVATPGVDDEAEAGSTATMGILGGVITCALRFPNAGNMKNNGGCVTGYDRGDGPVFDLSGGTQFQFDVQDVQGGMSLGISLVDTNKVVSLGFIDNVTPGQLSIPFDQLISTSFPNSADLASIDNIGLVIINQQGMEGDVTLGEFSTDGPIVGGPTVPTDDGIIAEEISGSYFNPLRSGEGCQLTLERDGVTFILTCYFYDQGKQFWLIGVGVLADGQIIFSDVNITTGTGYGDNFDPDEVVSTVWGSIIMTWSNCNNTVLEMLPVLPGYEMLNLDMTRIVPTICGGGGVKGDALPWMGAYFDPVRSGEGFILAVEGDGSVFVMTWYTYLNGVQVWMIGVGIRNGDQVVFDNILITSGANFGSNFDPEDVIDETFGTITLDFIDCNNVTATVDTVLPEFHDIVLDVTKIVAGACP